MSNDEYSMMRALSAKNNKNYFSKREISGNDDSTIAKFPYNFQEIEEEVRG